MCPCEVARQSNVHRFAIRDRGRKASSGRSTNQHPHLRHIVKVLVLEQCLKKPSLPVGDVARECARSIKGDISYGVRAPKEIDCLREVIGSHRSSASRNAIQSPLATSIPALRAPAPLP